MHMAHEIEQLILRVEQASSAWEYGAAVEQLQGICFRIGSHVPEAGNEVNPMDKLATKLLGSLTKWIKGRPAFVPYGFSCIKLLVLYCSKSIRLANHSQIMGLCEAYICYRAPESPSSCNSGIVVNEEAADVLSILHSGETAAGWGRMFLRYTEGCLHGLLQRQLGLVLRHDKSSASASTPTSADRHHHSTLPAVAVTVATSSRGGGDDDDDDDGFMSLTSSNSNTGAGADANLGSGLSKAACVARVFEGYCSVLQKMLVVGNGTGAVSVVMPPLLELTNVCLHQLPSSATVSPTLARNRIPNETGGVSPCDLSRVALPLKTACMGVLDTLLADPHPYLFRIADVLCRFTHHCVLEEAVYAPSTAVQTAHREVVAATTGAADVLAELSRQQSALLTVSLGVFMKALVCFPPATTCFKPCMRELMDFVVTQFRYFVHFVLLAPAPPPLQQPQDAIAAATAGLDLSPPFVATTLPAQRLVLQALTCMLAQCGALLPQVRTEATGSSSAVVMTSSRGVIRHELERCLRCLAKGVLSPPMPSIAGFSAAAALATSGSSSSHAQNAAQHLTTATALATATDRKTAQRATHVEALRQSAQYQLLLVQLATTEIMVPPTVESTGGGKSKATAGTSSHSVGLLRAACAACKHSMCTDSVARVRVHHPHFHAHSEGARCPTSTELIAQLAHTEMVLNTLLHPTVVPMPFPSVLQQSQECWSRIQAAESAREAAAERGDEHEVEGVEAGAGAMTEATDGEVGEVGQRRVREGDEEEHGADGGSAKKHRSLLRQEEGKEPAPASLYEDVTPLAPSSAGNGNGHAAGASLAFGYQKPEPKPDAAPVAPAVSMGADDDEDGDDLPDIDLS